jgi:hypothetical protein
MNSPQRPQDAPPATERWIEVLAPPFTIQALSSRSQCVRYDEWRGGTSVGRCATHGADWTMNPSCCNRPFRDPAWMQRMQQGQLQGKDLTNG